VTRDWGGHEIRASNNGELAGPTVRQHSRGVEPGTMMQEKDAKTCAASTTWDYCKAWGRLLGRNKRGAAGKTKSSCGGNTRLEKPTIGRVEHD